MLRIKELAGGSLLSWGWTTRRRPMAPAAKDILKPCNVKPDVEAGEGRVIEMSPLAISITKVSRQLRRVDEDAFTPHSVLIGLYNYHEGLSQRTEMKQKAVREIQSHDHKGLLMAELQNLEEKVRGCYVHLPNLSLSSELFCNMLLHDGCYLLLLFMNYKKAAGSDNSTPQDPVTGAGGVSYSELQRDTLFLCENQIPFIVLQKIHEHITGDTKSTLLDKVAISVEELLQAQLYISNKARKPPRQTSHLLDLVHGFFLPADAPKVKEENTARCPRSRTGRWRRATEYRCHANMRFKRKDFVDSIESSILDVSYQGGTLWIPHLRVDSNTLTILRNLMALEAQIPQRPVTAYCVFLSQIAGTVEDVKFLVGAGIVEQFLASEEQLAHDFANLLTGVVLDMDRQEQNYLKPIWHDLDMRCNKWMYRFMGTCRQQHCRNGLYTIAFIITAILFACGLLQAVFAVLSYKYKS